MSAKLATRENCATESAGSATRPKAKRGPNLGGGRCPRRVRRRIYFDGERALIPLANAKGVAIVDVDRVHLVASIPWFLLGGYAGGRVGDRSVYMHRLVLDAPARRVVDHVNFDTLDNRATNLRVCTARENSIHSKRVTWGRSGYRGVQRCRTPSPRWFAAICDLGPNKLRRIGVYGCPIEAARAYDAEARKSFGEFAVLNFPEGS